MLLIVIVLSTSLVTSWVPSTSTTHQSSAEPSLVSPRRSSLLSALDQIIVDDQDSSMTRRSLLVSSMAISSAVFSTPAHAVDIQEKSKQGVPLEEALQAPRKNRDMSVAREPMPNFSSTPGAPNDCPLQFWASWELRDRPRRIALLLDDCQEEYRRYATGILPNLVQLVNVFREKKDTKEGCPCIAWSAWSRTYDDGISNAMDRWYGPRGFNPSSPENAVYIFTGAPGMKPLREIEPTNEEVKDGWFYYAKHLDMFWVFDDGNKSYLDTKLKRLGIDTIVIAGLWTDECILATAYAGSSRGYDVVVAGDAVATATPHQEKALTIVNATMGKVLPTADIVKYMQEDYAQGQVGRVKGLNHPDGRKD